MWHFVIESDTDKIQSKALSSDLTVRFEMAKPRSEYGDNEKWTFPIQGTHIKNKIYNF